MSADEENKKREAMWATWPKGVHPIPFEGTARLGVGDDGLLYWDGRPIEIKRRFTFSRLQLAGAVIVGLATLIGGLGAGINEGFDFGCKLHWWSEGCSK